MPKVLQNVHYGLLTDLHNSLLEKAISFSKEKLKPADQQTSSPIITQYMSILSRVYAGSVNFELKEAELATLFCQFGGIKNINLAYEGSSHSHKGYGFIEFDNPEAAVLAIEKMEGVACGGRGFKMGRPSSFFSELPAAIPRPSSSRIYIANIHEYITEEDMLDVCGDRNAFTCECWNFYKKAFSDMRKHISRFQFRPCCFSENWTF